MFKQGSNNKYFHTLFSAIKEVENSYNYLPNIVFAALQKQQP